MGQFIPLAIGIGASLLQSQSQKAGGAAAVEEADIDAQQEELAVTQREVDRKERLAKALSSSIAGSGASGVVAFSGSPLSILQESIKAEEVATERDKTQTEIKTQTIRRRGGVQNVGASQAATTGLLSNAFNIAKVWPSSGG